MMIVFYSISEKTFNWNLFKFKSKDWAIYWTIIFLIIIIHIGINILNS